MKKTLTPDQKKYLQAWNNFNHVNKELTHFWTTVPRSSSGVVDWKQVTEPEMETFQQLQKRSKNYLSVISTLEAAGVDKEPVLKLLRLTNSAGINL